MNWGDDDATWLPLTEAALLRPRDVRRRFKRMSMFEMLYDAKYFGDDASKPPPPGVVHVLLVMDNALPNSSARPPLEDPQLLQGPMFPLHPPPLECFAVPNESIDAFHQITELLTAEPCQLASPPPPLILLHGPRWFGKTTLATQVLHHLGRVTHESRVARAFVELHENDMKDEVSFWRGLSRRRRSTHPRKYASAEAFWEFVTSGRRKDLFIVVDKMDLLLTNKPLAATFVAQLRHWQRTKPVTFGGFVGIGGYELAAFCRDLEQENDTDRALTFVEMQPFSECQMNAFFTRVERYYPFTRSLQQAIKHISRGAPGVFGSLAQFTVVFSKQFCDSTQWRDWLFHTQAFSIYWGAYALEIEPIQKDLLALPDHEWRVLERVLRSKGAPTAMAMTTTDEQPREEVAGLLQMRVLLKLDGENEDDAVVTIASEMMQRLAMETFAARGIQEKDLAWVLRETRVATIQVRAE